MEWKDVSKWLFFAGWSWIAVYIANSIKEMSHSMETMKDSVSDLNTHVAVIVEKVGTHEKRIDRLEEELRK